MACYKLPLSMHASEIFGGLNHIDSLDCFAIWLYEYGL
jgi:hypothetical protein